MSEIKRDEKAAAAEQERSDEGLLVDDDPDFLELTRRHVATLCPEYAIVTFDSGTEADEFLRKRHVDVIVTDYRMPLLNGLELITDVRAVDRKVPIVVMSDSPIEEEALTRGANAFVAKESLVNGLAAVSGRLGICPACRA